MSLDNSIPTSDANSLSLDSLANEVKEAHELFKKEKEILRRDKPDYPMFDENELLIAMKEFEEIFRKGGKRAALNYYADLGQFAQDYLAKHEPYSMLLRAAKFQF